MGAFSRDNSIEYERFDRQGGRCALCGKALVRANFDKGDRGAWHAHHIDGDWQYNALANCAVVCINNPENCHLNVAHGGNFRTGPLAPPRSFVLNR